MTGENVGINYQLWLHSKFRLILFTVPFSNNLHNSLRSLTIAEYLIIIKLHELA